jgi:hypothetical protein
MVGELLYHKSFDIIVFVIAITEEPDAIDASGEPLWAKDVRYSPPDGWSIDLDCNDKDDLILLREMGAPANCEKLVSSADLESVKRV